MAKIHPISAEDFKLRAHSAAGISTTVVVKHRKDTFAFDMGICTPWTVAADAVFVSHCHTDHIGGILAHMRARHFQGSTTYYLPAHAIDVLRQMQQLMAELDGSEANHRIKLQLVHPNSVLKYRSWHVKAIATEHRVPSLAYVFFKAHREPLPEKYRGLPGREIGRLKAEGVIQQAVTFTPELMYAGDLVLRSLLKIPYALTARVLITEVTFVDHKVGFETSFEKMHIHLLEVRTLLTNACRDLAEKCMLTIR
eukprot:TRINITY_DN12617_c2_g1_i17.p1 TRINITY_DN12617_c2_g1~~TRINITY_DN12617_c2_g1_i17.p1  ORF type:complete len:253 (+),score=18.23 TRINITY_DN12617_c2_g1_i17:149-907(+)